METKDKIFKLTGQVQHYVWGGFDFIPAWLGIENTEHRHFAEYWMGAHHLMPSSLITANKKYALNELIEKEPLCFLSEKIFKEFGGLPYLFKIMDVHDMLSIQVHPSKTQAEQGFEEEEKKGVPVAAPHRNYKDKNHKPEMLVALGEFWLLHGFKEKKQLKQVLHDVKEFESLIKIFSNGNYKALYEHAMLMPQSDADAMLLPLIKKEIDLKEKNQLQKNQPGWWVAKLFEGKKLEENFDKGIFSIYFFNIVKLNEGEAIFQDAGLPHAYLEGQNMELMAGSDNVLRGGLTNKHIDVPELMKHISFTGIRPEIIYGKEKGNGEKNYPVPAVDFGISKITLKKDDVYEAASSSFEIFCIMEGLVQFNGSNDLKAKRGEAVAILPGEKYTISAQGTATVYKAFVP